MAPFKHRDAQPRNYAGKGETTDRSPIGPQAAKRSPQSDENSSYTRSENPEPNRQVPLQGF